MTETWTCAATIGGRDPELADGCDQPAELFDPATGLWYCPRCAPREVELSIPTYGYGTGMEVYG